MSNVVRERHSLMFRPRSYMAFAITPQPPIVDWLSALDAGLGRSESFFAGQHVALDLSAVNLSSNAIVQLVASLEERSRQVATWASPCPSQRPRPANLGANSSHRAHRPDTRGRPPDPAKPAASITNDRGSRALGAVRDLHGR